MLNFLNFRALAVTVVFGVLAGMASTSIASPIVRIDGSSTVYPITEAVAEDFQIAKRGAIRVTVGISGTGGGFKKFCRDEIDIVNASRPIKPIEMERCKKAGIQFIEMPIAFDALTVTVNPRNTWSDTLTVADLKKIWEPAAQGKITKWNQINPDWPDKDIKLYGPGADSGTFDYFTEAVVGKTKSSRGDFTAAEDDNVLVQGVASDMYALGYFGFAYYIENQKKIRAVAVDNGEGGIIPSAEAVKDATYQPLSRPLFIYVKEKSTEKPEVKEFVNFFMNHGPALVAEVKFFPLPSKAYSMNIEHLNQKKVGTVFLNESEVGITIEEVLSREAHL
jgi:phosphate transport system substrate-binding protein